jgi:hypothetical protein
MVMGKAERFVAIESRIIDVGVSGIGLKFWRAFTAITKLFSYPVIMSLCIFLTGRDSVIGVVTRYGQYGSGFETGEGRHFLFSTSVQIGISVHTAYCALDTGAVLPRVKRAELG